MLHALKHSALALALGAALLSPLAHAAEATFDFGNSHTFLGFGTQVWLNNKNPGVTSQMLKDLNARFVRVSLNPKVPLKELREGMTVEEGLALIKKHDSAEQRERFTEFRDQMRALGITPHLIFWRVPEPWVKTQSKKVGSKSKANYAVPELIDDYARSIVAQLLYLKGLGIEPDGIELVNEPHGAWGTKFVPAQYAKLALSTRKALDEHGLKAIKIDGPGTGLRQFDHFIGGLKEANAEKALGYVSAHVYDTPEVLADRRDVSTASFMGQGKFGPIMITEFGVKQHSDEDDFFADDELQVTTPEFAVHAASSAVLLLGKGASGLIYWQIQDFAWQKKGKSHGMMSATGERRPVAHALQALFSKVPPGATVAQRPINLPSGVYGAALQSGKNSYVMLVNSTDQVQEVSAKLQGGSKACMSVSQVEAWSPAGKGDAAIRQAKADNCTLKATLGRQAVGTVILQ